MISLEHLNRNQEAPVRCTYVQSLQCSMSIDYLRLTSGLDCPLNVMDTNL